MDRVSWVPNYVEEHDDRYEVLERLVSAVTWIVLGKLVWNPADPKFGPRGKTICVICLSDCRGTDKFPPSEGAISSNEEALSGGWWFACCYRKVVKFVSVRGSATLLGFFCCDRGVERRQSLSRRPGFVGRFWLWGEVQAWLSLDTVGSGHLCEHPSSFLNWVGRQAFTCPGDLIEWRFGCSYCRFQFDQIYPSESWSGLQTSNKFYEGFTPGLNKTSAAKWRLRTRAQCMLEGWHTLAQKKSCRMHLMVMGRYCP